MPDSLKQKCPNRLCRQIERDLKSLHRAYKNAVDIRQGGTSEWLRDNFYLIEREGRAAKSELKHMDPIPHKGDLPEAYELCRAVAGCSDLEGALRSAIEEYRRPLGIRELFALPLLLKAAFVHMACEAAVSAGEEQQTRKIGRAVSGLRELLNIDFDDIIAGYSEAEKILSQDPAEIYPQMDEETKGLYLADCARLAEKQGCSEEEIARRALERARSAKEERLRHVGFYLQDEQAARRLKIRGTAFLTAFYLLGVLFSVLLGLLTKSVLAGILVFLPLLEALRPLLQYFATRGIPVRPMPKLDFGDTIPEDAPTLIVLSTLVPPPEKAGALSRRVEHLWRTNGRGAVGLCILADLRESDHLSGPEDKLALEALSRHVKNLNRQMDSRIILAVRPRTRIRTQGKFAGYERKRGAITQLVRYIKGENPEFRLLEGDKKFLRKVKYLIALDSDTELLMDSAARMVSAAAHPLNAPVVDEESRRVVSGYGILTPKMSTQLEAGSKTAFARIITGPAGITSYDTLTGDFYQDLFGESLFMGKGLIHVDAFYQCLSDTFEDERILSHDILEGGFLRVGFMSEIEMVDGCPATAAGYLSRMHRWVRGDWQNLPWLRRHPLKSRPHYENPLPGLTRYMLFDNLRRSLTPAAALLTVIAAAFLPRVAGVLIAAALLGAAFSGIFAGLLSFIGGGIQLLARKYYSKVMPDAITSFAQALLMSVMLIRTGFLCADAILRTLYRLNISKKHLLEWTTAAEADSSRHGIWSVLRQNAPPYLVAGLLLLSPWGVGSTARLMALLILVCPFLMWGVSLERGQQRKPAVPPGGDKLRAWASAMWRFYDELCGKQDNYLPPDNIQETPTYAIAHRTSPTNIGLMLLSILTARDFGFIDTASMCIRISRTLDSVSRLERVDGNLLNWYDTRTLQPLRPRFVSVVDSGNFACSLIALYEGLCEYAGQDPAIPEICGRIRQELEQVNLRFLYNKRRKLFHIGFDVEKNELSSSYYDLFMSESRMTSYYAIATRQVPKRHWGALGRMLAREGSYAGPVSWTGTMFEYFMPHLLLPAPEGSLQREALSFCLYCQRRRGRQKNAPYGCSESGFYAFDSEFNYQYKAHGVQRLGLRRGLSDEYVVSPYSTFLTLSFSPSAALRNLREMEEMGMRGRFGFYEAADFTPQRTGSAGYRIVRSYMAHHVGMSLISISNYLENGIYMRRFMRNPDMKAARELLSERIPSGARIFEDVIRPDVPEKPGRKTLEREEYSVISPLHPRVQLLSSGEWSLLITDSGAGVSMSRGVDLTRRSEDLPRRPLGIFAALRDEQTAFSLTAAPDYQNQVSRQAVFDADSAEFFARCGGLQAGMRVGVFQQLEGERREFLIKNLTGRRKRPELLIYLEPCLARTRDDEAHPAFSKLFLKSAYRSSSAAAVFWRISREGDPGVFLAVGFSDSRPFDWDFNRERVLSRPRGVAGLLHAFDRIQSGAGIPDPCLAMKLRFELPPKGRERAVLLLTAGSSEEEVLTRLEECRRLEESGPLRMAPSLLSGGNLESRLCASVLPALLYPADCKERITAARQNTSPLEDLWKLSISGDVPIVLCALSGPDDLSRAEPYIRLHRRLRGCGIKYDQVFLYNEGGEYMQPLSGSLRQLARDNYCEDLISRRGGIHFVDEARLEPGMTELLRSAARHIAPEIIRGAPHHEQEYCPMPILPVSPAPAPEPEGECFAVAKGIFREGAFTVTEPPALPWCHVLANEQFGTLISDQAAGYTFAGSSRENKLTPWYNDTRTDNRGELLLLRIPAGCYDLLWGSRATFRPDRGIYEGRICGLKSRTEISISRNKSEKYAEITLWNETDEEISAELCYYTEPVLGVTRDRARMITAKWEKSALILQNLQNSAFEGRMVLSAEGEQGAACCCDRAAFLSGKWDTHTLAPLADPCGALTLPKTIPPGGSVCVRFTLAFESERPPDRERIRNHIRIKTPDTVLNMLVNDWLPAQFEQCRLFGRTGFYQCGGAFGFRDQLQDICAELQLCPDIAREHILRCAANQFAEGDVLHWWHALPGGSRGVRTRCSDDMLWLPYTVCEYITVTGDRSVLDEQVPYLDAPELAPHEGERYFQPGVTPWTESIYEHCLRALSRVKTGRHGLPLIGGGDWNDGFTGIGPAGQGESVWLAQFAAICAQHFAAICLSREDSLRARELLDLAESLKNAVDRHAWNGSWYLRAFYDDGTPLGDKGAPMCEIDLLPQAFAALSGMQDSARIETALSEALGRLTDRESGILRLFAPSFDRAAMAEAANNPGYISAYPPGVRENGGQYTHAAVWFCLALLRFGRVEEGYRLLQMISPAHRSADPEIAEQYQTEPYFIAADVYAHPQAKGRGGWTLYTGAAGWYWRTVVQELLGLRQRGGHLELAPKLPSSWDGFEAELYIGRTPLKIFVKRSDRNLLTVDGEAAHVIPLDRHPHEAVLEYADPQRQEEDQWAISR